MTVRSLNPFGSDAVALAQVIASRARRSLTSGAEYVAVLVFALSAGLLVAVLFAVNVDFEVVAVTPGGVLMPLVQLDKENERAQRALLGELPVEAPAATSARPTSPQAPSNAPPQKAQQRRASSNKQ